jgi:hypothetical protein
MKTATPVQSRQSNALHAKLLFSGLKMMAECASVLAQIWSLITLVIQLIECASHADLTAINAPGGMGAQNAAIIIQLRHRPRRTGALSRFRYKKSF